MAKIVNDPYGWRLERDDRLIRAATFDGVGAYGDSRPAASSRHSNPSWNLVLASDGEIVVDGERLAGALIPPLVSHEGGATGGFVSLYIAPWLVDGPSRITPLTTAQVRRYLDALSDDWDLTAARLEVSAEFGAAPPSTRGLPMSCATSARSTTSPASPPMWACRLHACARWPDRTSVCRWSAFVSGHV